MVLVHLNADTISPRAQTKLIGLCPCPTVDVMVVYMKINIRLEKSLMCCPTLQVHLNSCLSLTVHYESFFSFFIKNEQTLSLLSGQTSCEMSVLHRGSEWQKCVQWIVQQLTIVHLSEKKTLSLDQRVVKMTWYSHTIHATRMFKWLVYEILSKWE